MKKFLLLAMLTASTAAFVGCNSNPDSNQPSSGSQDSSFKQGGPTGTGNSNPNNDASRNSMNHSD